MDAASPRPPAKIGDVREKSCVPFSIFLLNSMESIEIVELEASELQALDMVEGQFAFGVKTTVAVDEVDAEVTVGAL